MRLLLPLTLALMWMLSACAPAALPPPPTELPPSPTSAPPTLAVVAPTEAQTSPEPAAVPTSRGEALHASDPSQVVLGAGQPVLLEFFRFT